MLERSIFASLFNLVPSFPRRFLLICRGRSLFGSALSYCAKAVAPEVKHFCIRWCRAAGAKICLCSCSQSQPSSETTIFFLHVCLSIAEELTRVKSLFTRNRCIVSFLSKLSRATRSISMRSPHNAASENDSSRQARDAGNRQPSTERGNHMYKDSCCK